MTQPSQKACLSCVGVLGEVYHSTFVLRMPTREQKNATLPEPPSLPQGTEQLEEPERPQGRLLDDFDLKHSALAETRWSDRF